MSHTCSPQDIPGAHEPPRESGLYWSGSLGASTSRGQNIEIVHYWMESLPGAASADLAFIPISCVITNVSDIPFSKNERPLKKNKEYLLRGKNLNKSNVPVLFFFDSMVGKTNGSWCREGKVRRYWALKRKMGSRIEFRSYELNGWRCSREKCNFP